VAETAAQGPHPVSDGVTFILDLVHKDGVHQFSLIQQRAVLFDLDVVEKAIASVFSAVLEEVDLFLGEYLTRVS